MSSTNLELCVAAVRTWATGAPLSFSASEVTDGRRAPVDGMGYRHLHIQRLGSQSRAEQMLGARLRTYVLELEFFYRATDTKEEDALDEALAGYVEAVHDAFHGKGFGSFSTLTGIEVIEVDVDDRDPDDRRRTSQRATCRISFPFFEISVATRAADLHAEHALTIADHADFSMAASRSILLWVKPGSIPANYVDVLAKNTGVDEWYGRIMSTGKWRWRVFVAGFETVDSVASVVAGAWHMVAMVYDSVAATIKLSLDGVTFVEAALATPPVDSTSPVQLGSDGFFGAIDTVAFWTRALSQAEVTQLYASGSGLEYSELSAGLLASLTRWWSFNNNLTDEVAASSLVANTPISYVSGVR